MALLVTEIWRQGFVINTTNNLPVITFQTAGATMQQGFLRDADGRLVVVSG